MGVWNRSLFLGYAIILHLICAATGDKKYDPDVNLDTPDMIRRHGYPSETHVVQTADGYLLSVHRIPYSSVSPRGIKKPVVFLQHGLLGSSAAWVIPGPGKALAYILADAGYDVWLGNARGNTYSRSHVTLRNTDPAFWDFSYHEMGVLDLPAELDYITDRTDEARLFYVGHSMGTTMFYVLAASRPEYNHKVAAMFALAPVAYLSHIKSPIRLLAPWANDIEFLSHFLGADEFLPQSKVLRFLATYGCEALSVEKVICENAMFVLCGFDKQQFNETLLPVIMSHCPAGTATRVLAHFAQGILTGKFRQYDHGIAGNQKAYGQDTPPAYNLTRIQTAVALHVARNDWLASLPDVATLAAELPRVIGQFIVPLPQFNHLDFTWGKDANTLVYPIILGIMGNMTHPTTVIT